MISLAARIAELGVKTNVKFVGNHTEGRYHFNDWKVVLRSRGKQFTFPMVSGDLAGEPDTATTLNCLILDASCYFNSDDFRNFAEEFGWDIDSDPEVKEKARQAYYGCERAYNNLIRVFGRQTVKVLMFETESL